MGVHGFAAIRRLSGTRQLEIVVQTTSKEESKKTAMEINSKGQVYFPQGIVEDERMRLLLLYEPSYTIQPTFMKPSGVSYTVNDVFETHKSKVSESGGYSMPSFDMYEGYTKKRLQIVYILPNTENEETVYYFGVLYPGRKGGSGGSLFDCDLYYVVFKYVPSTETVSVVRKVFLG